MSELDIFIRVKLQEDDGKEEILKLSLIKVFIRICSSIKEIEMPDKFNVWAVQSSEYELPMFQVSTSNPQQTFRLSINTRDSKHPYFCIKEQLPIYNYRLSCFKRLLQLINPDEEHSAVLGGFQQFLKRTLPEIFVPSAVNVTVINIHQLFTIISDPTILLKLCHNTIKSTKINEGVIQIVNKSVESQFIARKLQDQEGKSDNLNKTHIEMQILLKDYGRFEPNKLPPLYVVKLFKISFY
ncbi:hypothetical protein ABPG74_004895 [Tetrahymena malaccensis]